MTRPLLEGLTQFPLVLHSLPPLNTNIPPAQLMVWTYRALGAWASPILLRDYASDAPTPQYYSHPPQLTPHQFMGLGKFMAGGVHQMRSAKSYLAAQPSWLGEDPDDSCPSCNESP